MLVLEFGIPRALVSANRLNQVVQRDQSRIVIPKDQQNPGARIRRRAGFICWKLKPTIHPLRCYRFNSVFKGVHGDVEEEGTDMKRANASAGSAAMAAPLPIFQIENASTRGLWPNISDADVFGRG
jgi:hypothetical protein